MLIAAMSVKNVDSLSTAVPPFENKSVLSGSREAFLTNVEVLIVNCIALVKTLMR